MCLIFGDDSKYKKMEDNWNELFPKIIKLAQRGQNTAYKRVLEKYKIKATDEGSSLGYIMYRLFFYWF